MYRKILVGGATAAVIVGAGTASLAMTGSDSTAGTPTASATSTSAPGGGAQNGDRKGKHGKGRLLRRAVHGELVTKNKDGYVTHNLITGTVTAVSGTSITVQAADKKSETYAVTKDTKVRVRSEKGSKPAESTISKVVKGDKVLVAGTGTSKLTAKHVIDVKTK